jgi:hypothetical protein
MYQCAPQYPNLRCIISRLSPHPCPPAHLCSQGRAFGRTSEQRLRKLQVEQRLELLTLEASRLRTQLRNKPL